VPWLFQGHYVVNNFVQFADTAECITDYIWFTVGKTIEALELSIGDSIQFEARICTYEKEYMKEARLWQYLNEIVLSFNS
jgi:hypothetical protein